MSLFALNGGQLVVDSDIVIASLEKSDTDLRRHAVIIIKTLLTQRAELVRILQAFMVIDDWTDKSIAPASTVREAQSMIASLKDVAGPCYDLVRHLYRQREFSLKAFGPGHRTKGVVDHIRKELIEIDADPLDLGEWIDVVLLGLDGAWRAGYSPEEIAAALQAKQTRNEGRTWPDWRTAPPDKAIEHVRTEERPS